MSYVSEWLAVVKTTPDARGDVIEFLRRYRCTSGHFPNQSFLYKLIRDKWKGREQRHLDACLLLWKEYFHWYGLVRGGGGLTMSLSPVLTSKAPSVLTPDPKPAKLPVEPNHPTPTGVLSPILKRETAYEALANEIWYNNLTDDSQSSELFITVDVTEPVRSGRVTTEQQAQFIADLLNQC